MYPQDFDEAAYVFDVESVMLGREHRTDDERLCWCSPCIERYPDGVLVIHRELDDTGH